MKSEITKERLEELINEGKSMRQIQKALKCAYLTVQRHLEKHGLKTKRASKSRFCKFCNTPLTGHRQHFCGDNCKFKYYYHNKTNKTVIAKCHQATEIAFQRKVMLVNRLGGKCSKCGYNKNLGALTFHHKDITTKSFGISGRGLSNKPIDEIIEEVDKCILLCHNCHMELHYPHLTDWNIKKEQ